MITKDLLKKTNKDLAKMIADQRKSIEKTAGDVYKGKEKNISKIKFMKREIARLKTLIQQNLKEGKNA